MLVIFERRGATAIASALAIGFGEEGERGEKRREFLRRAILIHLLVKGPWAIDSMHGWEQFHAMDLIIHNIDMPLFLFFLSLAIYVRCMCAYMCLYLSLFLRAQDSKPVSTKSPHGGHALYLLPLDFKYLRSSWLTAIPSQLTNHSISNVTH